MAHINVHLADADRDTGGGDELHPEGPLRLKVHSYEVKDKTDGTSKYISWRLDPSADGAPLRRPVWLNTSLKSGSLKGLIWFLDAIQIPYDKEQANGVVTSIGFDPDNCVGAEFMPNIGLSEYNGKQKNEVKLPYAKV